MMLSLLFAAVFALGAQARYDFGGYFPFNTKVEKPQAYTPVHRVTFTSCGNQREAQPAWNAILDYSPSAHIFVGDNVYGDVDMDYYGEPTAELLELEAAYQNATKFMGMAVARAATPYVFATWDDHDYGLNDAGNYFPYREQAQALFNNFWNVPMGDDRRKRGGVYHAEIVEDTFGTVQFIMLDTRYFRDNLTRVEEGGFEANYGPYVPQEDGTMLGDEQWDWLEEQLSMDADVRIIASSIQVLAIGHGWEKWGNMPHERKKLFEMIRKTKAGGVVFVSGDRHIGANYAVGRREARDQDIDLWYPLHETTSSGLSEYYEGNTEPGPLRQGATYGMPNFGTIDIDWWQRTIYMCVRDIGGECVRRMAVDMNEIHAGGVGSPSDD